MKIIPLLTSEHIFVAFFKKYLIKHLLTLCVICCLANKAQSSNSFIIDTDIKQQLDKLILLKKASSVKVYNHLSNYNNDNLYPINLDLNSINKLFISPPTLKSLVRNLYAKNRKTLKKKTPKLINYQHIKINYQKNYTHNLLYS
ncbi:hypothetical protein ATE90_0758 [Polaribacter sp. Hel1_33_96]|jgi:hypothetical protein|nr:hypothetical protein ATE90_0758 [Polaribacter sp. Hel1_33_96]